MGRMLLFLFISAALSTQAATPAPAFRPVSSAGFCGAMAEVARLAGHTDDGADREGHGFRPARAFTNQLIRILRDGKGQELLPLYGSGLYKGTASSERYVSLSGLLGAGLGRQVEWLFVQEASSLRYLPFVLEGKGLMVYADGSDARDLTAARLRRASRYAARMHHPISIIWHGAPEDKAGDFYTMLALVTMDTGGFFLDMNRVTGCGPAPASS